MLRVLATGSVAPALLVATLAAPAEAARPKADQLATARQHYNEGRWNLAIRAAEEARAAGHPGAGLVEARARLERYRQSSDPIDLQTARDLLGALDPANLAERDYPEYVVGLAQWLYLDNHFGAAVELFDLAMARADRLGPAARARILEWWAASVDRHAYISGDDRARLYAALLVRMDAEARQSPASAVPMYWVPAAARGAGDLDRAWHAAVAGWIRSRLAGRDVTAVRADLDRLVLTAIVPERARQLAGAGDPTLVTESMQAEWAQTKAKWPLPPD